MNARAHALAMPLQELLAGEASVPAGFNPLVQGLSSDSRQLREGDAFIALAGASTHGLRFAAQAQAAKVATILFETPAPANVELPASAIGVDGLRNKLGRLADRGVVQRDRGGPEAGGQRCLFAARGGESHCGPCGARQI